MIDLTSAKLEYSKNGVALIKNVFSKDDVDKIRTESFMCLRRHKVIQTRVHNGVEWPALCFWPRDVSEYLNSIRKDPRLVNIVKSFLGDEVTQLNNQIYYRLPGDGDQFAWHQDITFRQPPEEYSQIEDGYLQTIIVVDPIDENGAIEFVPGSHLWGDQNLVPRDGSEKGLRKFNKGSLNGVKYKANPGDVMVWSVMVVHGSETNESGRSRMTYMNGFAKTSCVKTNEFPKYLVNGEICSH